MATCPAALPCRHRPGGGGDHEHGGRSQITLLDLGTWRHVCAELEADIDPGTRRANVVLQGIDLIESRGGGLRIGHAAIDIDIGAHTTPCEFKGAAHAGRSRALRPGWGGGAFGAIVSGGVVRVGDPASSIIEPRG